MIHANLARARPHILYIHGMCGSWRVNGRTLCTSALTSNSSEGPSTERGHQGCLLFGSLKRLFFCAGFSIKILNTPASCEFD